MLKTTKVDEVIKSPSSDPPSDKRSDDEDEADEEKVHLNGVGAVHAA